MAILTGAEVISEKVGLKLENTDLALLGRARKVVVTKDETTIVDGAGDADQIAGRVAQSATRSRRATPTTTGEAAGAPGQAGRRCCGDQGRAATEVELKERKHRIEDAVRNAKAAVEEGIVAGGRRGPAAGRCWFRCSTASAWTATRRPGRTSSRLPSRLRSADRHQRRPRRRRRGGEGARWIPAGVSMRPPASTWT